MPKVSATWNDVATAPKDGTPLLLGWAPNGVIEHMENVRWRYGGWTSTEGKGGFFMDATHWRRPIAYRLSGRRHAEKRGRR